MDRNTELRIGLAAAASVLAACAAPQRAEVPATPEPEPVVVTPKLIQPIEYINGDGARVVSEGNKMTVSKDGLSVTVSCVPAHEYAGRMLPPHVDFSTKAEGLNDSRNYWLTIATPRRWSNGVSIADVIATGVGAQGVSATLHYTHQSIRGTGEPTEFSLGKPYTVSVFEHPYTNERPNFGFPAKQLTTLTPDCR